MRFTQRIDRWISHLRKALLAIIPKAPRAGRKVCGRGIIPHAPCSFLSVDQGCKKDLELVIRPACSSGNTVRTCDLILNNSRGPSHAENGHWLGSLVLRLHSSCSVEDVTPSVECSISRIGKDHFSRTEALTFRDARILQVDESGFRPGDQKSIVRERVTQGTQPVSIEFA